MLQSIKLTKEYIEHQIKYESVKGNHTFSMCRCNRQGCRGTLCLLCWQEKLKDFNP